MARFFFDIHGASMMVDAIGQECRNISEARQKAVVYLGGIMSDYPPATDQAISIAVRDAADTPVATVTMTAC